MAKTCLGCEHFKRPDPPPDLPAEQWVRFMDSAQGNCMREPISQLFVIGTDKDGNVNFRVLSGFPARAPTDRCQHWTAVAKVAGQVSGNGQPPVVLLDTSQRDKQDPTD